MTIEPEITSEKQHNLRAQYLGAPSPYNRKLIYSFLPKKHYVVLGQLLHFYLDRGMRLVKVLFVESSFVSFFLYVSLKPLVSTTLLLCWTLTMKQ